MCTWKPRVDMLSIFLWSCSPFSFPVTVIVCAVCMYSVCVYVCSVHVQGVCAHAGGGPACHSTPGKGRGQLCGVRCTHFRIHLRILDWSFAPVVWDVRVCSLALFHTSILPLSSPLVCPEALSLSCNVFYSPHFEIVSMDKKKKKPFPWTVETLVKSIHCSS